MILFRHAQIYDGKLLCPGFIDIHRHADVHSRF